MPATNHAAAQVRPIPIAPRIRLSHFLPTVVSIFIASSWRGVWFTTLQCKVLCAGSVVKPTLSRFDSIGMLPLPNQQMPRAGAYVSTEVTGL